MNFSNTKRYQQSVLHFSKWRNTNYAAFISIGRVVHIGKLEISIAEWIGNVVELVENLLFSCEEKESDNEDDDFSELNSITGSAQLNLLNIQNNYSIESVACLQGPDTFFKNNKIKVKLPLIGDFLRLAVFF